MAAHARCGAGRPPLLARVAGLILASAAALAAGLLACGPSTPAEHAQRVTATPALAAHIAGRAVVTPVPAQPAAPAPTPTPEPEPAPEPSPPPSAPGPTGQAPADPTTEPDPGIPPVPPSPTPPSDAGMQGEGPSWISRKVNDAINSWLGGLFAGAIAPLAELAGSLLDPKRLTGLTQIEQLWRNSAAIANSLLGALVVAGGLVVVCHETLQTRYALKQILPRLVVATVAANLSWWAITSSIELAAALAVAIAGEGTTPGQVLTRLLVSAAVGGPVFMVLLSLVVTVMAVALVLALLVVAAGLMVLTIVAPLALCLHALPYTDPIAWLWWRALAAVLAIPILHAVILALLWRIVGTPGGFGVFFLPSPLTAAGALLNVLVVIALLYLMLKIPRWMLRLAAGRPARGGRGLVSSTLRSVLMYAGLASLGAGPAVAGAAAKAGRSRRPLQSLVGSMLGGTRTGQPAAGSGGRGRRSPGRGAGSGPVDPYRRARVGADGQWMLPLAGVRRSRRRLLGPTPPGSAAPQGGGTRDAAPKPGGSHSPRRYRGRQTSLWSPAQLRSDPVLGRDGQYQLRIPTGPATARTSRDTSNQPRDDRRDSGARRGQARGQLALWSRADLSNRPRRDGQYPLPFPVTRVPRIPPASAGTGEGTRRSGRAARGGRQLRFPLPTLAQPRQDNPAPKTPNHNSGTGDRR